MTEEEELANDVQKCNDAQDLLEKISKDDGLDGLYRSVAEAAIYVVENHKDWLLSKL